MYYEEEYVNNECKEDKDETGQTDFYVIIDYKKVRGVYVQGMEDADGDFDDCLVIPMLKNGIKNWGKDKWRVILAARKSHRDENASHILVPQVEDVVQRGMVAMGYFGKYEHTAPIIGDVVPDITKIPRPPVFSENSLSYTEMERHRTENPNGGKDAIMAIGCNDNERTAGGKYLSDAQKRMREILLKKKTEEENG